MKFYSCPMCCNKGFTSQQDLKEHLSRATASMKCPACSKSFKNLIYLIKHLDQCKVSSDDKKSPTKDYSEFPGTGINADFNFDTEDDDDVEGYFCTVCDVKIAEVEEHVRKYHSGQEVILQDDDEEDEDTECSAVSETQYSSPNDPKTSKRKRDELINGADTKDKKMKVTSSTNDVEETDRNEVFYCPKCDMSFHSLSEHTSKYHKNLDVLVQDLSIHELFSASRQNNGAFAYFCSCCQKSIVRKKTLAKHLKLLNNKEDETAKSKHHNSCKKNKSYGSNSLDNSCKIKEESDDEQLDAGAVYEIEEVKPDVYDFDDLGHSIFNT